MTYEQAVARAFLGAWRSVRRDHPRPAEGDPVIRVYALRRLRVRAGLVP